MRYSFPRPSARIARGLPAATTGALVGVRTEEGTRGSDDIGEELLRTPEVEEATDQQSAGHEQGLQRGQPGSGAPAKDRPPEPLDCPGHGIEGEEDPKLGRVDERGRIRDG